MSKALWHLRYAPEAERNLKSFDRQIARRILKYLDERIAPLENPRVIGKALKGSKLGDFWRYDHGDYRIIVDIVDKEILICVDDLIIPKRKVELLEQAQKDVQEIEEQYTEGLITDGERYNKVVDIWAQVSELIAEEMMNEIGAENIVNEETGEKKRAPSFNPIFIMADSGARGSAQQIRQLAGMRGLMAKPSGEIDRKSVV